MAAAAELAAVVADNLAPEGSSGLAAAGKLVSAGTVGARWKLSASGFQNGCFVYVATGLGSEEL